MKTINKTYFVCEVCGKTSQSEEKVRACQEGHHKTDDACTITPVYRNGVATPVSLEIAFADGETVTYQRK